MELFIQLLVEGLIIGAALLMIMNLSIWYINRNRRSVAKLWAGDGKLFSPKALIVSTLYCFGLGLIVATLHLAVGLPLWASLLSIPVLVLVIGKTVSRLRHDTCPLPEKG